MRKYSKRKTNIQRTCKKTSHAHATLRDREVQEADSRDGEKERGRKCGLKMGEFSVGANFKGGALVGSNLLQVPETSNRQDIASSDRA